MGFFLAILAVCGQWTAEAAPSEKQSWPPADLHLANRHQAPLGLTEVQEPTPQWAASQEEVVSNKAEPLLGPGDGHVHLVGVHDEAQEPL